MLDRVNTFVGIDPDCKYLTVAVVKKSNITHLLCEKITSVVSASKMLNDFLGRVVERGITQEVAIGIEGQYMSPKPRKDKKAPSPLSIGKLMKQAGVIHGACGVSFDNVFEVHISWTGSISKDVRQRRLCKKLFGGYTTTKGGLIVPKDAGNFNDIKATEWVHLLDSIDLAFFVKEQIEFAQRVDEPPRKLTKL